MIPEREQRDGDRGGAPGGPYAGRPPLLERKQAFAAIAPLAVMAAILYGCRGLVPEPGTTWSRPDASWVLLLWRRHGSSTSPSPSSPRAGWPAGSRSKTPSRCGVSGGNGEAESPMPVTSLSSTLAVMTGTTAGSSARTTRSSSGRFRQAQGVLPRGILAPGQRGRSVPAEPDTALRHHRCPAG
jgi:hypothetical protein